MSEGVPAREPLFRILVALFGWVLAARAAAFVVAIVAWYGLKTGSSDPPLIAAITIPLARSSSSLILLYAARRGLREMPPPPARPLPSAITVALLFLVVLIGAVAVLDRGQIAAALVAALLVHPHALQIGSLVAAILAFVVLPPLAEERFFRDVMWRRLQSHGPRLTAGLTLMAWSLFHLRGLLHLLLALPLGVVVTWARSRTGSPRLGMALHVVWAVSSVVSFAAVMLILRHR